MVICDDRKSREIARHTYIHGRESGGEGWHGRPRGKKAMTISSIRAFSPLGYQSKIKYYLQFVGQELVIPILRLTNLLIRKVRGVF